MFVKAAFYKLFIFRQSLDIEMKNATRQGVSLQTKRAKMG